MKNKALMIGGGIALLAWLLTRDEGEANASTGVDVTPEDEIAAGANQVVDTTDHDTGRLAPDAGFIIHDDDGGADECVGANLQTISCAELDKRLLEGMQPGGIGAEAYN